MIYFLCIIWGGGGGKKKYYCPLVELILLKSYKVKMSNVKILKEYTECTWSKSQGCFKLDLSGGLTG